MECGHMGMFDINSEFDEKEKYTINLLCKEIKNEYYDASSSAPYNLGVSLFNKFKSPDKSGLINKLQKHLKFDLEKIVGNNPKERFDMLRLLKILYYIEKEGPFRYRGTKNEENDLVNAKLPIINILANPRLENIYTEYSNNSLYGEVFENLFNDVRYMIDDDELRCNEYEKICNKWLFTTKKLFDYVISDRALKYPENAEYELDRINRFLNTKILKKLDFEYPFNLEYKDGVLKNFFNVLNAHKLLCYDNERIDIIYNKDNLPHNPTKEYRDLYLKYEDRIVPWEFLDEIDLQLLNKIDSYYAKFVLDLISYMQNIDNSEIKHYRYALKHVKKVSTLLNEHKEIDFFKGINLSIFVAIMQEIIDIKRNNIYIENKYYGIPHTKISLKTCITNPEKCNPILKFVLISRIDNRFNINYGSYQLVEKKHQIELALYKIKEIILNYRNLNDMINVNDFIYRFISRSLFSVEVAIEFGENLHKAIIKKLKQSAKNIIFDATYCTGIVDFYKELFFDKKGYEDLIKNLSEQINNFFSNNYFQPDIFLKHNFKLNNKDFLINYIIDKKSNRFIYLHFFEVTPDTKVDELSKLGLEKFQKI